MCYLVIGFFLVEADDSSVHGIVVAFVDDKSDEVHLVFDSSAFHESCLVRVY